MYLTYDRAFSTHKSIEIDNVSYSFKNAVNGYRRLADYIYEAKFKDERLLELLSQANSTRDRKLRESIREKIYTVLKSDYEILRKLGIKQFHIHLADGLISFIRFHRPRLWGDSLSEVRRTLERCVKEAKPIHGYEEGRIYSGFRNVYPLMYRGKVVATVEISVGLNAVATQTLMDKAEDYAKIIIKRDLVEKKVFLKEKELNYRVSTLSSRFMEDKSREELVWAIPDNRTSERVRDIDPHLRPRIKGKLSKFESFSEAIFLDGMLYHVIFIPFKEIGGEWAGYLVYYQEDKHWLRFSFSMLGALVFFFVIYTLLFFAIYRLYTKVLELKSVDTLTGAWQRGFGLGLVDKLIARRDKRETPLSAIFIDIDNFKKINDTFGHDVGDKVLSTVAQLIKDRLRQKDIFLRYGGEEFLVILPDTGLKGAMKLAEDIRRRVEQANLEGIGKITVSIGVAQMRRGEEVIELINRADEAMYKAKAKGKNRVEAAE